MPVLLHMETSHQVPPSSLPASSFTIYTPLLLPLHHPSLPRLRRNPPLIRIHVPLKLLHRPPLTHPQAIAHRLQHRHIMTHHQHAPLEIPQRQAQRIHGLDIQMIARLVQHQDMRVRETQARERDARLLASREQFQALQRGRARDAEGAEVPPVLLVLLARVVLRHEADGAGGHVEGVDVVLGEEADAQAGVLADEAGGGLELCDEQFEDCGFAGAVGADDADSRVELHVEVDVAEEGLGGLVAEGDAAHLDDGRGHFLDVREAEVHGVDAFGGFQDGHLLEFLDAGLGFGGFGGVVAEFVDEGLEVGTLDHLVVVLALGGFAPFFFGGVEGICGTSAKVKKAGRVSSGNSREHSRAI